MKNLEKYIIVIAIAVRIILALPLSYLYIRYFANLGRFESLFIGIGIIVVFETIMIASSFVSIEIRKRGLSDDFANFMLFIATVLAITASYSIYHLRELFTMKNELVTTLPLHIVNWVSFIMLESVGIMHSAIKKLAEHEAKMAEFKANEIARRAAKAEQESTQNMQTNINVSLFNAPNLLPDLHKMNDAQPTYIQTTTVETPQQKEISNATVKELKDSGKTVAEIATILGVHETTIYRKLKKNHESK